MSLNRRLPTAARRIRGNQVPGVGIGVGVETELDPGLPHTCNNSPIWSPHRGIVPPHHFLYGSSVHSLPAAAAVSAAATSTAPVEPLAPPPPPPHPHSHSHPHAHLHQYDPNRGGHEGWDVQLDIQQHIQQCSCTCDHMGYGNFMDYQTACLPDVAAPRCNGRPVGVQRTGLALSYADSASTCSSKESVGDRGGAQAGSETRVRPWCWALLVCLVCGALGIGLGIPLTLSAAKGPTTHKERLDTVRRLLQEVPLIDGHNDLPWNMRKFVHNQMGGFNFSDLGNLEPWKTSNWSHTDLDRLRLGMVGAQFWSAYVPCGAQFLDAVQLTLEQIDVIKRLAEMHPDSMTIATTVEGLQDAHQKGRIASLIGVEGGHTLGNSLAVLRMYYGLGARYLTLTHSCDTPWAECSVGERDPQVKDDNPKKRARHKAGLTEFGELVVKEMNRLGMMVDLSHASVSTMRDALNVSKAPLVFSHSSAHALCNSTRNVPDDILEEVASNNGIVMVNFYTYFVTCNTTASIQDVIAHINHIRNVAGIDHVGIGAGYDGINKTPRGLEDVSKYPDLLATLLEDPNWSEEDVKKLAGGNLLRVFKAVEELSRKWRLANIAPTEELIKSKYLQGHTDCLWSNS